MRGHGRRAGVLLVGVLAGCGRCGATQPGEDAGPKPPAPMEAPALLPVARPWAFHVLRGRPTLAVPVGCRLREPTLRAEVPLSTGFVVERGSLATLIVGDATEDGTRLTGAGAMRFDATGALVDQRPVPWTSPNAVPRLGRTARGGWVATLAEQGQTGAWRAGLWRDGATVLVGEGDRFEVVDLWCERGQCALLAPRLGSVAKPGAEAWVGGEGEPLNAWRRVVIEPVEPDSDAHPLGIAGFVKPGATATATISPLMAIVEKGDCALYRIDGGEAHSEGRIPAPHGVLDVLEMPVPTAMIYGVPVDDDGCVGGDAGGARAAVRFAQPAAAGEPAEVTTPAPPQKGVLRRLGQGALATWIAPLGCGVDRRVVYAVRLDAHGKPAGAVLPVGDADRYAVASSGDDVDLWLQTKDAVTWVRLRCGAE